ncbi:uncharacterized protein LY89DRAFT_579036 [Mollisia scopiformis]|uniref:DUF6594 domain-containing protein n=1 Tax=Mollisia scopiformis TaxID=149040 RepID=A0A194XKP9_MOLSC|nr:uncharacterized protein LY89DRAFT_579036 [Mollisia scopiformis]KUJ20684.1 hypothetical protein LY89DRAFT_579036 [Mollisia scopiformis]
MIDPSLSPIEGYPKLARHMGTYSECAIYRRFACLNSQNLLYFQAELTHLEQKLRRLEAADLVSTGENASIYSKDWYWLNNSASEENSEQLETVRAIRGRLKEYNDVLIQQSIISRLADPNTLNLRSLQNWLERPDMGNLALIGKDRDTWGASDEPLSHNMDLLATKSGGDSDAFSTWVSQKLVYWLHNIFWHRLKRVDDAESGICSYEDKTLQKYTSNITTIVASSLPILAIVVLNCVVAINARLGLMALFTVVFAACLSFFTNATRGEIFIATSTFAAVEVVFISTNNGMSSAST